MKQIIAIASMLTAIAASTGQLPRLVHQVRIAQLEILKQMQTKNWGTPWTPSENKTHVVLNVSPDQALDNAMLRDVASGNF